MAGHEQTWYGQGGSDVRVEWGPVGANVLGRECACLVVVDVLSFTTSVTVAVERGMRVYPYPWRDDATAAFAAGHDAVVAAGRRTATDEHPWSLSPAALVRAPLTARLVLPSPNGSTIARAASRYGVRVVAACLRNASAVAAWLASTIDGPIGLVPAGERWPDGSLRPALEDAIGAGAVVAALRARRPGLVLSAEARGLPHAPELIRDCASARELAEGGFADDVAVAAQIDASPVVPLLGDDGAFTQPSTVD